jgi:hypothetical protein
MISLRGYVLAKMGRRREAEHVLSTLQALSEERYVPPYASALVHTGLGDLSVPSSASSVPMTYATFT